MKIFPIKMSEYSKEVKSRYIVPFSFILAFIALLNCYLYVVVFKSRSLGLICFLCAFAAVIIPLFKYKTKYHELICNYLVVISFVCLNFLSFNTGGVLSNAIWWLGTVPLVATFLMNAFFGATWFCIILIDFFVIFYLGQKGVLPINILAEVPPEKRIPITFTVNAGLIAFLCVLSELIKDRAFLEKEELRLKTFQLNQMASLGKMASGVAHEINNPLTVIRGAHIRIQRLVDSNEPIDKNLLTDYMSKVHRNILRIQDVTGLLGTISEKARDRTISSINVNHMLEDIIQMRTEDLHRYSITLVKQFPEEELHFKGIFTELFQAVLNVVEHAIFELKDSSTEPKTLRIGMFSMGNDIRLMIEDNGDGIPADMRLRIFDPFFRSNSFDDHKGLGLSFSHSVLITNGGTLELLNSAKGTSFQIILPRA